MKRNEFLAAFFLIAVLGLTALLATACGNSSSPTSSGFILSGTVTYQGSGSNHVYVLPAINNGVPVTISSALSSGGTYSFSGLSQATELFVAYDNAGTGLKLSGGNLVQGNGSSIGGTGDVTCVVGYTGSCPNTSAQAGTFYTAATTVPIIFGGSTNGYAVGQSGTNCTQ